MSKQRKVRKRLSDFYAEKLGFDIMPKDGCGRNHRYSLNSEQLKTLKGLREFGKSDFDWGKLNDVHYVADKLNCKAVEVPKKQTSFIIDKVTFSDCKKEDTFNKNKGIQKWLILPDIHRPFQNKVLEKKVLQLIKDLGTSLYGINISGDYLDLYTLGSYNAESLGLLQGITLEYEYLDGLKGIVDIESSTHKDVKKQFLYGNHCDRYFREVNKKDNAKYGGALKHPTEALELDERGWDVKTNWKDDYFTLGKHLDVMHGMFTNVHAAYNHLLKTNHSCIFGHTHRIQSYHLGNRAAYNIGGLYDKDNKAFHYMPRLQREVWANGFAMVYIDDNGNFYVEQVNVWNNKFFTNGKMY